MSAFDGVFRKFGHGVSNVGLEKTGKTLNEVLNAPEREGYLTGFLFDTSSVMVEEVAPYDAPTIQDLIEETPEVKPTVRKSLWQYRGGAAILAAPGDVLPKVYGTTIVQGRVIWAGRPYLDANNRSRIDIAYGLCQGEVDEMLKIYGGNDKQLLWAADSVDGNINGNKYWNNVKLFTGSLTQTRSKLIKTYVGADDVPYYHGLCYVVFKGLKLFKFNKTAPDLWFVVGRGLDEESDDPDDEYGDGSHYNPPTTVFVSSIAGHFDFYPDTLFVSGSNMAVWQVTLSTNTWLNIGSGVQVGGTNIKFYKSMQMYKGKLHLLNRFGLWRYDDTPGSWTNVVTTAQVGNNFKFQLHYDAFEDVLIFFINEPLFNGGTWEHFKWNGTTLTQIGNYNRLDFYSNNMAITTDVTTGDVYSGFYKTTSNATIARYEVATGTWARQTETCNANIVSSYGLHYDATIGRYILVSNSNSPLYYNNLFKQEWVQSPAICGANTSTLIYDDNGVPIRDCERFNGLWHVTFVDVSPNTPRMFREESIGSVTTMPVPALPYYNTMMEAISGDGKRRLFAGMSRGFYEQSAP